MTTYYVAKSGSDSGKGTSGSPWKTISKAMKANLQARRRGRGQSPASTRKRSRSTRTATPGTTSPSAPRCPAAPRSTPLRASVGININANYVKIDGFEVYGGTDVRDNRERRPSRREFPTTSSHNNQGKAAFPLQRRTSSPSTAMWSMTTPAPGTIPGISIHLAHKVTGRSVRISDHRPGQRLLQQLTKKSGSIRTGTGSSSMISQASRTRKGRRLTSTRLSSRAISSTRTAARALCVFKATMSRSAAIPPSTTA